MTKMLIWLSAVSYNVPNGLKVSSNVWLSALHRSSAQGFDGDLRKSILGSIKSWLSSFQRFLSIEEYYLDSHVHGYCPSLAESVHFGMHLRGILIYTGRNVYPEFASDYRPQSHQIARLYCPLFWILGEQAQNLDISQLTH